MPQLTDRTLAHVLEAVPDAMVCVDSDGDIALVNTRAAELFRYEAQELAGRPLETLVPEKSRDTESHDRTGHLASQRPRPMGTRLMLSGRRRDGTTFPAEIAFSTADTSDGTLAFAAVRDLTARLAAQAERERLSAYVEQQELERRFQQAERLQGFAELAGGNAHDFSNLLSVVTNYTALLAEEVNKEVHLVRWPVVRSDVGQIRRAAQRASDMTHQLLACAHRDITQLRLLDINETAVRLAPLLNRILGGQVELTTDFTPGAGLVLADPGEIEQIIVNLVANAHDAMPDGGQLMIATGEATVDDAASEQEGLPPGAYVRLGVSDSGAGIPPEVLSRALEPYFTTKPHGSATGLGLATVDRIVRRAGGCVRLHSQPGSGTTATILLPAVVQPASWHPGPAATSAEGNGEVVLVVANDPDVRKVTQRILGDSGYRALVAADGQEAIDLLTGGEERVDVLLTDIIMPQMLGMELADQAEALRPGIRVGFMSGYARSALQDQQGLDPAVNLLEKPFTATSLLHTLRKILAAQP